MAVRGREVGVSGGGLKMEKHVLCVCSLSIQESNVTLYFVGMTHSDLLHHFNQRSHQNSSHRVHDSQPKGFMSDKHDMLPR